MSRMMFTASMLVLAAASTGCTAVNVQPISSENQVEHICIQHNPRVQVSDFVDVMQEGFGKHGITSEVINSGTRPGCGYTASYTARRSWDFSPYLSQAQIAVQKDGRQIAQANYHLRGKGGFSLTKWANTRSKILPVIDELLARVTRGAGAAAPMTASTNEPQVTGELAAKLSHLKDAYDAQLISQEEYESKRKSLIETF